MNIDEKHFYDERKISKKMTEKLSPHPCVASTITTPPQPSLSVLSPPPLHCDYIKYEKC